MKIKVESKGSDFEMFNRLYPNQQHFHDRDAQSAHIRDLTDTLDATGVSYEVYNNVKDNGCTVFYEDSRSGSMLQEAAEKDPLVIELNEFLQANNFYENCYETTDGRIECEIINGDWKHEHLRFKLLVDKFFQSKGIKYDLTRTYYQDDDSAVGDWFTATYHITVIGDSAVITEGRDDVIFKLQKDAQGYRLFMSDKSPYYKEFKKELRSDKNYKEFVSDEEAREFVSAFEKEFDVSAHVES